MTPRLHPQGSAAPSEALAANGRFDRRGFLVTVLLAFGAAFLGEWGRRRWQEPRIPEATRVATLADLVDGDAFAFELAEPAIAGLLVQNARGSWIAFDRKCTHLGCPVVWSAGGFDCPCHVARFDGETGAVLAGPPRRPLRQLDVEVRAGEVFVGEART